MGCSPFQKRHLARRVASEDVAKYFVHVGMNLVDALRAGVDVIGLRETEIAPLLRLRGQRRRGEMDYRRFEPDQLFQVMVLAVIGLYGIARDKVIHLRAPRGGAAPIGALNRGQPEERKNEFFRARTEFVVDEDIELLPTNPFNSGFGIAVDFYVPDVAAPAEARYFNPVIAQVAPDKGFAALGAADYRDLESVLGQVQDQPPGPHQKGALLGTGGHESYPNRPPRRALSPAG
jgi:hypothetical protein